MQKIEKMVFSTFTPQDSEVELRIYSLRDPVSRSNGLNELKSLQGKGYILFYFYINYFPGEANLRVIVGGGDGSIMWAVQEMISAQVSFEKCVIGTIPFGTGNDFSRVLGWGRNFLSLIRVLKSLATEPKILIGTHLNSLKGLMTKWVEAEVVDFDIWEIVIETHEV